ncbi:MAG: hypothetical protein CVT66_08690 [Actinobacteria bacterium HGW-Actinobacteria-6]|nr:MAG: hypothetical protein CVT66_08690 [Actinobacteria bacterium HGW-Actinobacteria-6]
MAECAFHPGVETNVRCAECERPICPKDMVSTPVGYKCRECARPAKSALHFVKPRQWALGVVAGLSAGVGGGILLGWVLRFGSWFAYIGLGILVGEAVRRGTGGHRTPGVTALAAACAAFGAFVGGLEIVGMAMASVAAAFYLSYSRR